MRSFLKKTGVVLTVVIFTILVAALMAPAAAQTPPHARLAVSVYRSYLRLHGFKPDEPRFHSIGHSHIDAAWKWRIAETHKKVQRTFSNAVRNMDEYEGFVFAQSQPQFYEWILFEHPELFAAMQEMARRGQWEIVGGMWVEPDCNMPEGESLIRQRLCGQRFYLEHFGKTSDIEWLPDSFGYNRNLPQIVARSGGRYLWAKKINTNFDTVFPFHQYWFQSPDGSRVLTTLNPASVGLEFMPWEEFRRFKRTRYLLPKGASLVADYSTPPDEIESALSDEWLYEMGIFYGEGDGGEGPTDQEIQIQKALVDRGYTRFSTAAEFFADLEPYQDRFPVWNDEMYFERHRGVQTTHAWIKRANRKAEQELRTAESLRAVMSRYGLAYPQKSFIDIWKMFLLQQFHDILPGSSIPEVYVDARKDFDWVSSATREIVDTGLLALGNLVRAKAPATGMETLVVWNSLAFERSGLARIRLAAAADAGIYDGYGAALPCQVVEEDGRRELVFVARDVPSLGYKTYFLGPAMAAEGGVSVKESETAIALSNGLIELSVDKRTGLLVSMIGRDGVERLSSPSNRILVFRDRHKEHRAWNIEADYINQPIATPEDADEVAVTSRGPLWGEITVRRSLEREGKTTTFEQKIRVFEGDPISRLSFASDFHVENALVKLEFNATANADLVAADGPYLVLERPTHPVTPAEVARWEMPCHKWIDLADEGGGLALFNNGKYGFSLTPDGRGIRQTVIKAAEYPEAYQDAENVVHYKPGELPYTDQGPHYAEFGLHPHGGSWKEAGLWEMGYGFNNELETVRSRGNGALPEAGSFLSVSPGSVFVGSVKLSEDGAGWVLRLVETSGRPSSFTISPGLGLEFARAWETDLLEVESRRIELADSGLIMEIGPYEIRTVKVELR